MAALDGSADGPPEYAVQVLQASADSASLAGDTKTVDSALSATDTRECVGNGDHQDVNWNRGDGTTHAAAAALATGPCDGSCSAAPPANDSSANTLPTSTAVVFVNPASGVSSACVLLLPAHTSPSDDSIASAGAEASPATAVEEEAAEAAAAAAALVGFDGAPSVKQDGCAEAAAAHSTATFPSASVSDGGDSTSDNGMRRMPRMVAVAAMIGGSGDTVGSASPGGGSSSSAALAARAAADLAKAKEREEQVRLRRELINREKQKKIDELLEAQRQAQEYRRRQEDLRRQKIEEMKRKEEERQKHAEDRRLARDREDEERRSQLQQRKLERRQRLEEELSATLRRRSGGRRTEIFGFGSSSPRFEEGAAGAAAAAASGAATGKRSSSISNLYSATGRRVPSSGDSSDGGGEAYICPRFRDYHRRCLSAHADPDAATDPGAGPPHAAAAAAAASAVPSGIAAVAAASKASTPVTARQLSKSTSNLTADAGVGGNKGTRARRLAAGMSAATSMLAVTPEVALPSRSDTDTSDSASLLSGRRSRGGDSLSATPRGRAEQRHQTSSPPTSDGGTPTSSSRRPGSGSRPAARPSRSVERRPRVPGSASATSAGPVAAAAGKGRVPASSRAKSAPARNRKASTDNQLSSPRGRGAAAAASSSSSDEKSPRSKPKPAWVGVGLPADDGTVEELPAPSSSSDNMGRVLRSPPPAAAAHRVTINEKTLERLATPKTARTSPDAAAADLPAHSTGRSSGITAQAIERLATPKSVRISDSGTTVGDDAAAKDAKQHPGPKISSKTLERLAAPKRQHGTAADDSTSAAATAPAPEEATAAASVARPAPAGTAGGISLKTLERLATPKRTPAEGDEPKATVAAGSAVAAPERPPRKKTKSTGGPKQTDKPGSPTECAAAADDAAAEPDSSAQPLTVGPADRESEDMSSAVVPTSPVSGEEKPGDGSGGKQSPPPPAVTAAPQAASAASGGSRPSRPAKRAAPRPPSPSLIGKAAAGSERISTVAAAAAPKGSAPVGGVPADKQSPSQRRPRPLSAKRAPRTQPHEGDGADSADESKAKSVASVAIKGSPEHHARHNPTVVTPAASSTHDSEAAVAKSSSARSGLSAAATAAKSKFPKSKSHDILKAAAATAGASAGASPTPIRRGAPAAVPGTSAGLTGAAAAYTTEDVLTSYDVIGDARAGDGAVTAEPAVEQPADAKESDTAVETPTGSITPPEEPVTDKKSSLHTAEVRDATVSSSSDAKAPADAYKMKLAEKRRQAREKADREAEEERKRQEEQRRAEEEAERRQAEEENRQAEEERRLAEEATQAEQERLRLAIEEAEKRRKEQADAAEAERLAREEADRKLKEEADRRERALRDKIEREEAERLERKKKLESIMKRVKTEPASQDLKKNDSVSSLTSMTDSFISSSAGGKSSPAPSRDLDDSSKFRSPLLNSLIAGRSKSDAALKTDETGNSRDGSGEGRTGNGLNGANHDSTMVSGNGENVVGETATTLADGERLVKSTGALSSSFSALYVNNNVVDSRNALSEGADGSIVLVAHSATSGSVTSTGSPALAGSVSFGETIEAGRAAAAAAAYSRSTQPSLLPPPLRQELTDIVCLPATSSPASGARMSPSMSNDVCDGRNSTAAAAWQSAERLMVDGTAACQESLRTRGIADGDEDDDSAEGQVWQMVEGTAPYALDCV